MWFHNKYSYHKYELKNTAFSKIKILFLREDNILEMEPLQTLTISNIVFLLIILSYITNLTNNHHVEGKYNILVIPTSNRR